MPKFSRILQNIVIGVLFCGLVVQVSNLSRKYLRYESVIQTKFNRKIVVDIPSITLCFDRSVQPKVMKEFKSDICERDLQEEIDEIQEVVYEKYKAVDIVKNNSEIGININKDSLECQIYDYEENDLTYKRKSCNDFGILTNLAARWKCFTLFSKLDSQNRGESLRMRTSGLVELKINVTNMYGNCGTLQKGAPYLSVHSKWSLPNGAEFSVKQLQRDQKYFVDFTKSESKLLAPPYDTNCHKYSVDELSSNQAPNCCFSQHQSQSDCIAACMKERSTCYRKPKFSKWLNQTSKDDHKKIKCVDAPLFLFRKCMFAGGNAHMCRIWPDSVKECPRTAIESASDFENCLQSCPQACEEDFYDYMVTNDDAVNRSIAKGTFEVLVYHKSVLDIVLQHCPAMSWEEYLSDCGGQLGGWLALSLLGIYHRLGLLWKAIWGSRATRQRREQQMRKRTLVKVERRKK